MSEAEKIDAGLSSTGFSLWILILARTKPHRLKPVLLKAFESSQDF
jgi:hypothetical protein